MNATPRVRSGGFPQTPGTVAPRQSRNNTPTPSSTPTQQRGPRPSLPPAPESRTAAGAGDRPPLIPLTVIDAPSQRFYAVAVYVLLFAWRFWDWIGVVEEDTGSFALFMKWFALDFVFLFVVLPAFRIPWLDLSQPVVIGLFAVQMALNWVLMFNLQVSWTAWLLGVVKLFYDKGELSISEHNVKVSSILHNSSLIMGKQIINILPEGSALLNPEKTPFCIGPGGRNVVLVPLYFNATVPAEVELIRIDLDINNEEVIKLTKSQIREIDRQAKKITEDGAATSYKYDIPVKKAGAYRLSKVLDEYKLEVQRPTDATYVVPCPKAQVRHADSGFRCINDLSNLSLDVHGTPPLKIVYSRTINGKDHGFHFQSLQPDGFSSPLLGTALTSPRALSEDVSWARAQSVAVALNESMNQAGQWQYSIDEVHDVFGNVVKYTSPGEESEVKPKAKHLVQNFLVRERPQATLRGCDLRNPLKVAKGQATQLPISFNLPGPSSIRASYELTWQFSPIDTLSKSGDHGDVVEIGTFTAKNAKDQPTISAPGLYTLKSITCESCEGEIEEPSSCLLLNPLEPNLKISHGEIPDKCAGKSIGLRVDLDLVGTPPFKVAYDVISDTERSYRESVVVRGLRQQIDLLPRNAGHYQYRFRSLEDAIYKNIPLPLTDEYFLEQNVKPPASAYFREQPAAISACLDEPIKVDVALRGEGPFTLEWELVHDGRKKSEKVANISADSYTIETAPLSHGGDYTLALTSVVDTTGCRIFLKEEIKITVRRQRPRAAFGVIENRKMTSVVEDAKVNIPLKLSGEAPWKVTYRNVDGSRGEQTMVARSSNDFLEVAERGTFEILDVSDKQCHGQIDPKMATFQVNWFARPELALVPTHSISGQGDVFVKQDVCEGDVDGFEVALKGSPPYHVSYEIKHKPRSGSGSIARKEFDAAMPKASIPLDTSKAGHYTYKFSALADNLYNNDKRKFQPLTLEQTVNAKPTASFVKPGQIFKLCMSEQDYEEKIPITLQGVAPFSVEIEIRHHAGSIPETFRIATIPSNSYGLQIPRQYLKLGAQTVRIREVRDARDCRQNIETGGSSVQVQLYDAPAIYPLETRNDYCVGERIAYTLSGTPPFEVQYTFAGSQMKAKSQTTNFRRIAEAPGDFSITSISDKASECRAAVHLSKTIHPMPSVRISRGKIVRVDIHEGSEVEILFEFWGTAPFEFTYTRSSNAKKGQKSQVLETRHDVSYENTKVVTASLEGTYEVVAIKDKFCAFSTMNTESKNKGSNQKMLTY